MSSGDEDDRVDITRDAEENAAVTARDVGQIDVSRDVGQIDISGEV